MYRLWFPTPALTPSLVVSRRKAWRGVIGLCHLPRIGVGVPGGAGVGGRTGRNAAFNLPARVGQLFGGRPVARAATEVVAFSVARKGSISASDISLTVGR